MSTPKKRNRRSFINSILVAGTATGIGAATGLIIPKSTDPGQKSGTKVKMLTADGKLVEVDQSVIDKLAASKTASDKEVFEWMDKKHKS